MSSFFAKLNLRPQEKRLVVAVVVVVFIVLNAWFIYPHRNDWQAIRNRSVVTEQTLKQYQEEVNRIPAYNAKLDKLKASGSVLLSEELELQRTIETHAQASGVLIQSRDPRSRGGGGKTNQFFEDQTLTITCTTGPKELVDFLVNLASGNSMIRVREMKLGPDGSQTKLLATLTFVASYQKKPAGPAKTPLRGGKK